MLERGADCHIEDLTGRDACDYAELGDVHVFPELNKCRQNNMHLRTRCNIDQRQTVDQARKATLKGAAVSDPVEEVKQVPAKAEDVTKDEPSASVDEVANKGATE